MNTTEHALRKKYSAAPAFSAEYVLIALAVLVNLSGLFTPIQEPDAALYAGIAKKMVLSGNYLDLFSMGADWLDKPHFPFWVTALSFKIFGIDTFAYKIPGVLFTFLAARYTYLLAKDLYDQKIAFWSVIILLCSQHIILSDSDVRAEP
jgi:4-amino-4-deoxy-L-arabinose transferase-like glycosyltransferase